MNRLQSELQRLYVVQSPARSATRPRGPAAVDPRLSADPFGAVRAMVVELTRPASWDVLSKIWYGVQADLELPAPAIAVSGVDGLQLWFSVEEPITVQQARSFMQRLQSRYLPEIASSRLHLFPAAGVSTSGEPMQALSVPALHEPTGNWSAFIAPDLAPVFAETPWLDIPPNEEGQAALLRGLSTIKQPLFEAALLRLGSGARQSEPRTVPESHAKVASADDAPITSGAGDEPRRFLLAVMNDDSVALSLRIEAAKALLGDSNAKASRRLVRPDSDEAI